MRNALFAGLTTAFALVAAAAGGHAHPTARPHGTVYVTERSAGTASAFDAATGHVALDRPGWGGPIGIVRPRGTRRSTRPTRAPTRCRCSTADRRAARHDPDGPAAASPDGQPERRAGSTSASSATRRSASSTRRPTSGSAATSPVGWPTRGRTRSSSRGRDLYATNTRVDRSQPGDVAKLDARTGALKCNVVGRRDPSEILVTPSGRLGYVSVRREDKVKELDLRGAARC